jgi:hypothetical protein
MIRNSQPRRGAINGTRAMAALALFFSILACLMAGVVMLRTGPEGGGVQANLQAFREEAGRVFGDLRARFSGGESGDEASEAPAPEPARETAAEPKIGEDESGLKLEAIKERVDEIEEQVRNKDATAGDRIDALKEELARLKEFTTGRGGPLLDQIGSALTDARDRLADDSAEAARRLRVLSDDLVRRSREQTERLRSGPGPDVDEATE